MTSVLGSAAELAGPGLQLALVVNGRPAPRIVALREGMDLMIPLEATLDALHITHSRDGADVIVEISGTSYTLSPGSHIARQDGTEALQLVFAPIVKEQMYLAPADMANLLGVDVRVDGASVVVASDQPADADATVEERPVPRTHVTDTRYARTGATPAPTATEAPVAFVGRIGLTLVDSGGQQSTRLSLQGAGDTVRGSIAEQGSAGTSSTSGSVFLGDQHRSTTLGNLGDPLGGAVFQASGAIGVSLARNDGRLNYTDALRSNGTRIYSFENRELFRSSEVAIAQANGTEQLLVGQRFHGQQGGLVYSADAWAGSNGLAAGLSAKTTGRLFLQGSAAIATGDLPLQTGDLSREISLGFKATPALTVSGGAYSALGIPFSAFAAASLRTRFGSLGISQSRTETVLTADASNSARFVNFNYVRSDGSTSASVNAASGLRRGAVEFSAQTSTGNSGDTTLQWRAERLGPSLVAGVERVWSDGVVRLGAVAGVAFPIFGGLSLEATLHPLLRGNGLRVSLVQDVVKHRRVPTQHIALHLLQPAVASQLWVDGVPFARMKGSDGTFDIPATSATVSVRSIDGKFGSPSVNLVRGSSARLDVPMWPIGVVRGRIVVENANPIDAQVSLEHALVMLEATGIVTEVRTDGSFEMPPQPIPPNAVVRIDEESLPDAFSAGPSVAASGDGETILTIHGRRTVERKSF